MAWLATFDDNVHPGYPDRVTTGEERRLDAQALGTQKNRGRGFRWPWQRLSHLLFCIKQGNLWFKHRDKDEIRTIKLSRVRRNSKEACLLPFRDHATMSVAGSVAGLIGLLQSVWLRVDLGNSIMPMRAGFSNRITTGLQCRQQHEQQPACRKQRRASPGQLI